MRGIFNGGRLKPVVQTPSWDLADSKTYPGLTSWQSLKPIGGKADHL
jgi:hypothetical protein